MTSVLLPDLLLFSLVAIITGSFYPVLWYLPALFIAVAFSIFHVGLIDDVRSIEIHNIESFAAIYMYDRRSL